MFKFPNQFILLFILCLFSSCATIFYKSHDHVNVLTNEPCKLIVNSDTLKNISDSTRISVFRSKKPIIITAFNDSLKKTVIVNSKNSILFYLNFINPLTPISIMSVIIDYKTKQRFNYPKDVYIELNKKDSAYLTYNPFVQKPMKSSVFKFTPLKLFGIVNPSFELVYEFKLYKKASTQLMVSGLLPNNLLEYTRDYDPNTLGYRVSIEEKFYSNKNAPYGRYLGFEFSFLRSKYSSISYFGDKYPLYQPINRNYLDTFGVFKKTYSFNIKIGYQYIKKNLAIDIFGGIGIRFRDVSHYNRMNPKDEMELPRHPNIYYITNVNRKNWSISLPLNIRIGWAF